MALLYEYMKLYSSIIIIELWPRGQGHGTVYAMNLVTRTEL